MIIDTAKLLTAQQLVKRIFAPECRPTLRTIRTWTKQRRIPCYRIGRLVFYDEEQVRAALQKKNIIRAV